MRFRLVVFFVILFGFLVIDEGLTYQGNIDYRSVDEAIKRSEEWIKRLNGTLSGYGNESESMRKKAEELKRYSEGKEFMERVDKYKEEVGKILGKRFGYDGEERKRVYNGFGERGKRIIKGERYVLSKDEKIYVFVSSSIEEVVRRYVADSFLVMGDVKFVLRGAVGGLTYLRPTAEWVLNNLLMDKRCNIFQESCELYDREFFIDPLLFRRFGVKRVPVVVYVKGEVERPELVVVSPGAIAFERHLERIFQVVRNFQNQKAQ